MSSSTPMPPPMVGNSHSLLAKLPEEDENCSQEEEAQTVQYDNKTRHHHEEQPQSSQRGDGAGVTLLSNDNDNDNDNGNPSSFLSDKTNVLSNENAHKHQGATSTSNTNAPNNNNSNGNSNTQENDSNMLVLMNNHHNHSTLTTHGDPLFDQDEKEQDINAMLEERSFLVDQIKMLEGEVSPLKLQQQQNNKDGNLVDTFADPANNNNDHNYINSNNHHNGHSLPMVLKEIDIRDADNSCASELLTINSFLDKTTRSLQSKLTNEQKRLEEMQQNLAANLLQNSLLERKSKVDDVALRRIREENGLLKRQLDKLTKANGRKEEYIRRKIERSGDLEKVIEDLEEARDVLSTEKDVLEKENEEREGQMKELQHNYDELLVERNGKDEKIDQLEKELEKMKASHQLDMDSAIEELENTARLNLAQSESFLSTEKEELSAQCHELQSKLQTTLSEKEELEKTYKIRIDDELTPKLNDALNANKTLKDQIRTLQDNNDIERREQTEKFDKYQMELETTCDAMKTENNTLSLKCKTLQEELDSTLREADNTNETVHRKEAKIADLTQTQNQFMSEMDNITATFQAQITDLKQQHEAELEATVELEKEISEQICKIESLQSQIQDLEESHRVSLDSCEKKSMEEQQKLKDLHKEVVSEKDDLTLKYEELNSKLDTALASVDSQSTELEIRNNTISSLKCDFQKQIEDMKATHQNDREKLLHENNAKTENIRQEVMHQKEGLASRCKALQSELDAAFSNVEKQTAEIVERETEIGRLQNEQSNLVLELENRANVIINTERDMEVIKSKNLVETEAAAADLKRVQGNLEVKEAKLAELQTNFDDAILSLEKKTAEDNEKHSKIESLEDEINKLTSNVTEKGDKINEMKDENEKLLLELEKIPQLENEIEKLKEYHQAEVEMAVNDFLQVGIKFDALLKEAAAENDTLLSKCEDLRSELDSAQALVESQSSELETRDKMISGLKRDHAELVKEFDDTTLRLQSSIKDMEEENQTSIETLQTKLDDSIVSLNTKTAEISEQHSKIDSLKAEINQLMSDAEAKKKNMNEVKSKLENLEEENLSEKESLFEGFEKILKSLKEARGEPLSEVDVVSPECENALSQLDVLLTEVNKHVAEIESKKMKIDALEREKSDLMLEREKMAKIESDVIELKESHKAELETANQIENNLKRQMKELETSTEEGSRKYNELESLLSTEKSELSTQIEELKLSHQSEVDKANDAVTQLQEQVISLEDCNQSERQKNTQSESCILELQSQIESMEESNETELVKLESQISELQSSNQTKTEKVSSLETQIEDLRKSHQIELEKSHQLEILLEQLNKCNENQVEEEREKEKRWRDQLFELECHVNEVKKNHEAERENITRLKNELEDSRLQLENQATELTKCYESDAERSNLFKNNTLQFENQIEQLKRSNESEVEKFSQLQHQFIELERNHKTEMETSLKNFDNKLNGVNAQKEEALSSCDELRLKLDFLSEDMETQKFELKEQHVTISELGSAAQQKDEKIAMLEKQLKNQDEMRCQIEELQGQIQTLNIKNEEEMDDVLVQLAVLTKECEAITSDKDMMSSDNKRLESELESLRSNVENKAAELIRRETVEENLKAEIAELNAQTKALISEKETLQSSEYSKLAILNSDLQTSEAHVESKDHELQEMGTLVNELKTEKAELKSQVELLLARKEELETNKTELQSVIEKLRSSEVKNDYEIDEKMEEYESLMLELEEERNSVVAEREHSAKMNLNQIEQHQLRIQELEIALRSSKEQLKDYESKISEMKEMNSANQNELELRRKEVQDAHTARDEASHREKVVEGSLQEQEQEQSKAVNRLSIELEQTKQQLHDTRLQMVSITESSNQVHQDLLKNNEDLARSKNIQIEALKVQLQSAEEKLRSKESESRLILGPSEEKVDGIATITQMTKAILSDTLSIDKAESEDFMKEHIVNLASALEKSENEKAEVIERIATERKAHAESLKRLGKSMKRYYSSVTY